MENNEQIQPNPQTDKVVKSKEEMTPEEKIKGARSSESMADLRMAIDNIDVNTIKEWFLQMKEYFENYIEAYILKIKEENLDDKDGVTSLSKYKDALRSLMTCINLGCFSILIFAFLAIFILNLEVQVTFLTAKIVSFIIVIGVIFVLSYFLLMFLLLYLRLKNKRDVWKFKD